MSSNYVLIWDWDGTLVDSLDYKYGDIWDKVFLGEPERVKIVKDFIKTSKGKGVNRYGLIKHTLLNTGLPELAELSDELFKKHSLITKYVNRYDQLSKFQIEEELFLLAGVKDMLERLQITGYSMYIISGGGTDNSLQSMAESLGIRKYFRDIFGFGGVGTRLISFGKRENFDRLIKIEQNFNPSNCIIIGDGETDLQFANDVGCRFIGIANEWNKWQVDNTNIVSSVTDVEKLINP